MIYEDHFDVYVTNRRLFHRKKDFVSPLRWDSYEEVVDGFNRINGTTLEDWKVTDGGSSLTIKLGNLFSRLTVTVMPRSELIKAIA
jgi:hypothetical protein